MEYSDNIVKAVIQGILTSTVSCYWVLNKGSRSLYVNLPLIRKPIPISVFMAVLGAISSVGSDLVHTFIKKEVPISAKTQEQSSMILGALLGGGVMTLGLYLTNGDAIKEYGLLNALLVGGASDIASSFATNMIFE